MRSLSWLCAVISIKSGGVLLVLWSQTCHFRELMLSWKCIPYMRRQIPTLTYTWVSNFAINERFNLELYAYTRHNSCHMHNVSSMTENRWLQPQFKYYIVHKTIVRYTRETIFNFGPKSNC